MYRLGRPGTAALEAQHLASTGHELTYDVVGSALADGDVPGYDVHREERVVGAGPADFTAACDGVRAWVAHGGVGATVHPARAPIEVGSVVVVVLPAGPLTVLAPCRVVAVVDEPDRFGFAYGTLPGHPVSGEEAFVVERRAGGEVVFSVRVVARPGSLAMRLGGPVARAVEHRAVGRYLAGMARHVARTTTGGPA